jgi:hypothetical protein
MIAEDGASGNVETSFWPCDWGSILGMTGVGYTRLCGGGQSGHALPFGSDINLLGNGEGVVNLDTEVSDGAFYLRVPEEELNRPQIAGAPVYQSCFRSA